MWWNLWVRVRIFQDSNSFFYMYHPPIPLILKVVFWIYLARNVLRERDSDLVSTLSTEGSPLIFGDGGAGAQGYFWKLQSKVNVLHEKFQFLLDFFGGGAFGDLNPMSKLKMRHFNLIWGNYFPDSSLEQIPDFWQEISVSWPSPYYRV